jgi:PIN domain nuclease of toxin-antitoxin system
MKGILLDTHVWIWLMEGAPELGRAHQKIINQAAQHSLVGIAAISLWEISMLIKKGRIRLEKPLLTWIKESLAMPGIELKPLTPEIAVENSQLPDGFHGDPADRLIVSTARVHGLSLLTRDEKILEYVKQEYLDAIAV